MSIRLPSVWRDARAWLPLAANCPAGGPHQQRLLGDLLLLVRRHTAQQASLLNMQLIQQDTLTSSASLTIFFCSCIGMLASVPDS